MTGTSWTMKRCAFLAAFVKSARETGVLYCALTVGFKDGPRYYGKLFSASHKNHRNAPDYHGYICLLPVTCKGQYTEQEWRKRR